MIGSPNPDAKPFTPDAPPPPPPTPTPVTADEITVPADHRAHAFITHLRGFFSNPDGTQRNEPFRNSLNLALRPEALERAWSNLPKIIKSIPRPSQVPDAVRHNVVKVAMRLLADPSMLAGLQNFLRLTNTLTPNRLALGAECLALLTAIYSLGCTDILHSDAMRRYEASDQLNDGVTEDIPTPETDTDAEH